MKMQVQIHEGEISKFVSVCMVGGRADGRTGRQAGGQACMRACVRALVSRLRPVCVCRHPQTLRHRLRALRHGDAVQATPPADVFPHRLYHTGTLLPGTHAEDRPSGPVPVSHAWSPASRCPNSRIGPTVLRGTVRNYVIEIPLW